MRRISIIAFCILSTCLSGQISGQFVEEHAIEITNRAGQNDSVCKVIKDYKAILIGEVHGIQEAPEFLLGIVKSLTSNGKKVIVGLEIPADALPDFSKKVTIDDLKKSSFFTTASPDGRQCIAWGQMLMALKTFNVPLVFFDLNAEYRGEKTVNRDSMMYVNLNNRLKQDTSLVLVTLSGNISNMMVPYRNKNTMACYLQKDEASCLKTKKILSLNFIYGKGTTMNWLNDGYKLREVEATAGFYEYTTPYDNFLFIYPIEEYGGILFSKTITASGPLTEKP